jgi:hypothetical protein
MLLRPPPKFTGFRRTDFDVFALRDRDERRHAIIEAFHPGLKLLGDDVLPLVDTVPQTRFHAHLPRLDWPKGYDPFCTWLALSRLPHGYQAGPQLNVGVHADYVAARLAWDTAADAFGRFEFRCRIGDLGRVLAETAQAAGLTFRVYAAAPMPVGSRCVFESATDWDQAFIEVARRGVWWELGRRWDLPDAFDLVTAPEWSGKVGDVFEALAPAYRLID